MTPRDALLITACVFICPLAAQAKSPARTSPGPAKNVECWEIMQDNKSFGPIKMNLAPQGARVEIQNLHVAVVCQPPTWRVSVFNPVTKQELSSSIEKWARVGLPMDEKQGEGIPTEKGKASKSTYVGMNAILFKYPCNFREKDLKHRSFIHFTGANYYASSDVALPRQEVQFLRGLFRTPDVGSIPLALILDSSAGPRITFKANSATKTKIPLSDFSYPKEFKPVSTASELTMGYLKTKFDLIQEFAGEMSGAAADQEQANKDKVKEKEKEKEKEKDKDKKRDKEKDADKHH